jgi:tight adherence protein B
LILPNSWLGVLCGLGVAAGVLLAFYGLQRQPEDVVRPTKDPSAPKKLAWQPTRMQVVGGVVGAVFGFFGTRWPVTTIVSAMFGFRVPGLAAAKRERAQSRLRLVAVASWIENVRDLMSSASGIDEALRLSAEMAPTIIAPELFELTERARRASLPIALQAFGEQMADPVVDYVAAALVLSSERGGHVKELLGQAAQNARAQLAMRERIEATRSRTYMAVTTLVVVTLLMTVFLFGTQGQYMDWYGTFSGQVAFAIIGGLMLFGLSGLTKLSRPTVGQRLTMAPQDGLAVSAR